MVQREYNRAAAVVYAREWALGRNPAYYNFDNIGGDCTNFVSQCLYAGAGVMNFTPDTGWYYLSLDNRAAAWTSVKYLHQFLTTNQSVGPYAYEVPAQEAMLGDVIQLGNSLGEFYHSLMITGLEPTILISCHTYDSLDRPLYTYSYQAIRFLHIAGVRAWQ